MFKIERNSTSPPYTAQLKDVNDKNIDLTDAVTVKLKLTREIYELTYTLSIVNAVQGKVKYEWELGDTNYLGLWKLSVEVTYIDTMRVWPETGDEFLLFTDNGGVTPPEPPTDVYMKKADYDVDENLVVDTSEESIAPKTVDALPTGKEGDFVYDKTTKSFYIKTED